MVKFTIFLLNINIIISYNGVWVSDDMVNFIICDNEKTITESVKSIITKTMFKTNIEYKTYTFNDYDKEFDKIINTNLENKIYILDIEVGSKSGIEIAKKIRNKDWNSIILILTAHYELEYLAYKSKILLFDFISKFDLYDKKMTDTINVCVNNVLRDDKLKIKVNRKYEQIEFSNILYLTYDSYNRKLKIITKEREYETISTLKEIKKKLKGNFIYTHRSCIVNMKNVKTIDFINKIITFTNKTSIDLLSRRYIKEVKKYVID